LGGSDDEGIEGFFLADEFGGAVLFDLVEVIAPFSGSVEEDEEGPTVGGLLLGVWGQGEPEGEFRFLAAGAFDFE
jgi:hypothetical protein